MTDGRDWKHRIQSLFDRMDSLSDNVRWRVRRVTGFSHPLMIVPHLGFGTPDRLLVGGRVLEDKGFMPANDADTTWRNLVNMYRRFATDEVPGARLRALFKGIEKEVVADYEGYFSLEITPTGRLDPQPWQEVALELLQPRPKDGQTVSATARALVPAPTARFGIISDIDDTIIRTNVANRLKMILTVILLNEHTRKPFKGVAAFYRALHKGTSGEENNPFFYVSSSAWNLYTLLVEFLDLQGIPMGPLFLKDFGDHLILSSRDHHGHKMPRIRQILAAYPELPFVLVGDSGERDPEIYRETVKEFPGRIRAIYIRSVVRHPSRLAAIDQLIEEVQHSGSQLVLAPDSEFAAAHAAAEGLIATRELSNIRGDKENDQTLRTSSPGFSKINSSS